ncbi:MAG: hypothetical protein EP334_10145 [Gammaproteobacteria bacterium]|nr:MAG: hypothetical protein EP334_10145 [Gammaproteobacteria bacterium]
MAEFIKHEHIEQAVATGKLMVYGGSGTTFGAKLWAWFGENNDQITSVCSIIGAVVCVAGFALNIYISSCCKRGG